MSFRWIKDIVSFSRPPFGRTSQSFLWWEINCRYTAKSGNAIFISPFCPVNIRKLRSIFNLLCGVSKGFMKAFKTLNKNFWDTTKVRLCKLFFSLCPGLGWEELKCMWHYYIMNSKVQILGWVRVEIGLEQKRPKNLSTNLGVIWRHGSLVQQNFFVNIFLICATGSNKALPFLKA